jgi:hypothetical protein
MELTSKLAAVRGSFEYLIAAFLVRNVNNHAGAESMTMAKFNSDRLYGNELSE